MIHPYKFDQGYWTRTCSAIAGGALILSASVWLYQRLSAINMPEDSRFWIQMSASGLVALVGIFFVTMLVYIKPGPVEFLIATDGEMRKVNWSSRREILGSTWVVIFVSLSIAAILLIVDLAFSSFFQAIKILKPGA